MNTRDFDSIVLLRCSQRQCPRTKKIPFDARTMPAGTTEILSHCPWHVSAGDFETESYFNAAGNPLECQ